MLIYILYTLSATIIAFLRFGYESEVLYIVIFQSVFPFIFYLVVKLFVLFFSILISLQLIKIDKGKVKNIYYEKTAPMVLKIRNKILIAAGLICFLINLAALELAYIYTSNVLFLILTLAIHKLKKSMGADLIDLNK